jgi:Ca-activated chloride channel homolog
MMLTLEREVKMRKLIGALGLICLLFSSAQADGLLMPRPEPWLPYNAAVNVKFHDVTVTINDPIATTRVDQVFINPYGREIEADYIFPIPENAAISDFTAWLGDHKMQAELLDATQARQIYEEIVSRRKDPALLEYAGRGLYRMRIYPIPAYGEVRIKLEYQQTLKADGGTVEYLYPLNTEKFSGARLEHCKVEVTASSFEDIGTIYCPSHQIKSERLGPHSVRAIYSEENVIPDKDIVFVFTRQKTDFGFHLLSYRERGHEQGYFLGILSPPLQPETERGAKNVIFILDSSGSMAGEKFEQAIGALKFCLNGLGPNDRFNILDYDDVVRPYKPYLIAANQYNISEARHFADGIAAAGGTNIYEALASACGMIGRSSDPTYIIFLTDGQPTVGITEIDKITANTRSLNEDRARLFVFGVGYDVNAHLLDRLAEQNGGLPEYVQPDENIESKVSRLATKISHPALTDLTLTFSGVNINTTYPSPLPDLFYGSEIILTGCFDKTGPARAILTGKSGGHSVRYEYPVVINDGSGNDEFIPLQWANRRIAYLLQEIRLHGRNEELLTEVIELSKKYGIVTEYTSFLISGDENTRREAIASDSRKLSEEKNDYILSDMAMSTGKSAVDQSQRIQKQSQAFSLPSPDAFLEAPASRSNLAVTQVGSQGFFQVGENWIQGDLTGDKYDLEIKRFSRAYFQILEKDPSLGKYFGLGNQVRLKIGSQVVQVADSGKESLTDSEIRKLFPAK